MSVASTQVYGSRLDETTAQSAESWRVIPGYEGLYEVSDLGNVRSLDRTVVSTSFGYRSTYFRHGVPMRQSVRPDGRRRVCFCKSGERSSHYVHLLVLLAFVGARPGGMEGCHNDGNPANNCLSNIRYDTPVANAADRRRHGTCYGRNSSNLPVQTVLKIKELAAAGISLNGVARQLGLEHSTVRKIAAGKRRLRVVAPT